MSPREKWDKLPEEQRRLFLIGRSLPPAQSFYYWEHLSREAQAAFTKENPCSGG